MKKLLWIASLITLQVWALEDENQSELLGNEFGRAVLDLIEDLTIDRVLCSEMEFVV